MPAKRDNIISANRNRLEDVIPLDTPYTLAIDPCNLCNFKCKFCAMQSSNEAQSYEKQMMPLSLFKKIIDDISVFPNKLKVLRVNGQGEPLLNKDITEMIRYAKSKGVADFIETITNGSRLNPQFNRQLIESGINRVRISVEAVSAEGYYEIAGVKIDFEKFLENIRDLHERSGDACEIYIKTVDAAVDTPEKEQRYYQLFEGICDRIWIDGVGPLWSDWDELNQNFDIRKTGMHGQKLQTVQVCPYSFYSLIINADGEVTVCCADWRRKFVVGDLKRQSLYEIWNSERLRTFWKDMLSGRKDQYEMCRKCLLPMYDCNDNIDSYAEQILRRITSMK